MIKDGNVLNYFESISEKYDANNEKLYWKLSDKLLWYILKNYIPKNKKFSFLDLGGGTGEWTKLILDYCPLSTGILVDFSDSMLKHANLKLINYGNRIKIINSDIHKLHINNKFDLIINIYLLPFFDNTDFLIKYAASHLKQNGKIISVAENYYNGLALITLKGNIDEVKEMVNFKRGKLSESVPKLKFNTVDEIKKFYNKNNINVKDIYGFPVVSPIGYLESLTLNKNGISKILNTNFEDIYNTEKKYIKMKELVNRGKYICVVGEKNEKKS